MANRIALPRELRVGAGATAELGSLLEGHGIARVLVVTDPFMVASGAVDGVLAALGSGVDYEVFGDVVPDPTTDCVDQVAAVVRAGTFDAVIGFGGGSSLDTAKAAALIGRTGRPMRDYRAPTVTDRGALPVVAIPTTAGSGSECTQFAVITDSESHEKMLCVGLAFLPTIAIVDYELTLSMPPRLTADTGLDALTHAIESYVSRRANSFADTFAERAMAQIFRHIRTVYRTPDDTQARAEMMLGATNAGIAFSNSSVALVHGMSRPIGGHFGIAHGLSNAMLLPAVTGYSVSSAPDRYAQCARVMGVADAGDSDVLACDRLVDALTSLNHNLAVPAPAQCAIDEAAWLAQIPLMAKEALASGSPANNPRVPSVEDIEALYQQIWTAKAGKTA